MTRTYMIGSIEKIDVVNNDCILKIKEHNNLLLILDGEYYHRNLSKLKKGGHFLFEGHLVYSKPGLSVRGKISEVEDFPEINVTIFPEKCKTFRTVYKKNKTIAVIGELHADKPELIVKKVKKTQIEKKRRR